MNLLQLSLCLLAAPDIALSDVAFPDAAAPRPADPAGSPPAAVKFLAHAFRDRDISVRASSLSGHSIALLEIQNCRPRTLVVDVNGSYLRSVRSGDQRLGIGIVRAGSKETSVQLAAGQKSRLKVLSVCMDSAKSSPSRGRRYRLATSLAPGRTLEVLRQWKEHPLIPQSEIQSAVWGARPARTDLRISPPLQKLLPSDTAEVLPHDGLLFVRQDDGTLLIGRSTPSVGRLEPSPGRVRDIWSGDGLFAIRRTLRKGDGASGVMVTTVSRFESDTGGWTDLPLRVEAGTLEWVAADGESSLVASSSGELLRATAEGSTPILDRTALAVLHVMDDGGILSVTRHRPNVLVGTRPDGRTTTLYRHGRGIRDVVTVGRRIWILDQGGSLLAVEGTRARRIRGAVRSVDAYGSRLLLQTDAWTEAYSTYPAALVSLDPSGGGERTLPLPHGEVDRYLVDPVSSRLFCVDDEGWLKRFDETRGRWMRIGSR